jgi:hypothetical protein
MLDGVLHFLVVTSNSWGQREIHHHANGLPLIIDSASPKGNAA